MFKELNSLKTGRTWDPYIFKRPLDFDEQESSGDNKPEPYLFDPKWTEALPARVSELKGTFHITSGVLRGKHSALICANTDLYQGN